MDNKGLKPQLAPTRVNYITQLHHQTNYSHTKKTRSLYRNNSSASVTITNLESSGSVTTSRNILSSNITNSKSRQDQFTPRRAIELVQSNRSGQQSDQEQQGPISISAQSKTDRQAQIQLVQCVIVQKTGIQKLPPSYIAQRKQSQEKSRILHYGPAVAALIDPCPRPNPRM